MAAIKSFRDLEVYKLGLEEARKIFLLTKSFSTQERYALTDQIRRSSRAVNAMIAEGWARRRYPSAFVNKMNEAMGEAMETQAWLDHALACSYIDLNQHHQFDVGWQHIGAMLNRMIEKQADFCRSAGKLQ
ncbi:MAG TPA: four helix bundle protein [Terriglobia bacterium]|nr:four helix bundle protein [Terriglobia bacterium]